MLNASAQAMLKRTLKTWEPLLFEQNAIAFLLQVGLAFLALFCVDTSSNHFARSRHCSCGMLLIAQPFTTPSSVCLQDPERLERVRFETEYCINCAWAHGLQGKLPFIKRFSECSFCTGFRNSREVRVVTSRVPSAQPKCGAYQPCVASAAD